MNCPYCGISDDVKLVGVPTPTLLVTLGPHLGLGVISIFAAAALVLTYKATGKLVYKCSTCNKYFIA